MPGGNIKGTGVGTDVARKILTTDETVPDADCGFLITAGGVDAGGTYHVLLTDANGQLQLANFTALTLSNRVEEIDPISQHYVAETLADVTDQADATYDYYVDMSGYSRLGFQLDLSCGLGTVTATVWATLQDDGTAPGACGYIDVTNAWFGVANLQAAAGTASAYWNQIDIAAKYVRVRIVAATGGAGAQLGDWTIYHKRLY